MSEHWSADCFHVNVTYNATTVVVECQQHITGLVVYLRDSLQKPLMV